MLTYAHLKTQPLGLNLYTYSIDPNVFSIVDWEMYRAIALSAHVHCIWMDLQIEKKGPIQKATAKVHYSELYAEYITELYAHRKMSLPT